jgi:hypothetical protein
VDGVAAATDGAGSGATATTNTVLHAEQRAFKPAVSSFSGGTRIARRQFGHSTVTRSGL